MHYKSVVYWEFPDSDQDSDYILMFCYNHGEWSRYLDQLDLLGQSPIWKPIRVKPKLFTFAHLGIQEEQSLSKIG